MKSLFESKTFWFNILSGAIAAADIVTGSGLLSPWALVAVNAVNIFLRTITKEAVSVRPA